MPTRAELLGRLSTIPTPSLLEFLDDKILQELATRYFNHVAELEAQQSSTSNGVDGDASHASSSTSKPKAKRPLNAFMAFRCKFHTWVVHFQTCLTLWLQAITSRCSPKLLRSSFQAS